MKKTVITKLKSQSGESISEVLIASLVVSLAFVMVLSLIMASQKLIQKTDARITDYYNQRNKFETNADSNTNTTGTVKVSYAGASGVSSYPMGQYTVDVQSGQITADDSNNLYISYKLHETGN